MSEADGMAVADLEVRFAELDGYTAEARAGELLLGLGIPLEQHFGPMSEVAPGWKLRVLLAQALFSDPDVLLLDEPTNHLDINTIRWLEGMLTARNSTMIIISHDRHFLNSVCTHMADLDYGEIRLFPGNYDDYMTAATRRASACTPTTPRRRRRSPTCRPSSAASRPTPPRPSRPPPGRARSTRSSSRRSSPRAGSAPSSASSRRRSCIAWRSTWRGSPRATPARRRCSNASA
jgi:ATPase subunit of ABC transporter with duplicated ATPase domains